MYRTQQLRQHRIAQWLLGIGIAAALLAGIGAFATLGGPAPVFTNARQGSAPLESVPAAPVSGPYELYHTTGAPPAMGAAVAAEDTVQTPWQRYHCTSCPRGDDDTVR